MYIGKFILFCEFQLLSIFVVTALLNTQANSQRHITVERNPGCNLTSCHSSNSSVDLIYIRSEGNESCAHYLLSTIHSPLPTLLLLKTKVNTSKVSINWNKLLLSPLNSTDIYGAITVVDGDGNILNESADSALYIFNQVVEYKDVSDTADIFNSKAENITVVSLSSISWNITLNNDNVYMQGTSDEDTRWFTKNSSLQVRLTPFTTNGYDSQPPRLVHNDLSMKLEFVMNNLTTSFTNSRFSVSIIVANPGNLSFVRNTSVEMGVVSKQSLKSIDDEYAPSVFTTTRLLWKHSSSALTDINFWQWRTVCYTKPNPTRKFSSDIKSSSLVATNRSLFNPIIDDNRFLISYFGHNLKKIQFKISVLSFGKTDDEYYRATNYLSWSSLIGFGTAPNDSFSLLVICIILIGVGCPALVLIAGGVYMLFRKYCNRNTSFEYKCNYQPIG